jgi:hypothetical protein
MHIAKLLRRLLSLTVALACVPASGNAQSAASNPVALTPAQVAICDPHKSCDHNLCDARTCDQTLTDYQQMLGQLHITSLRPGPANHKDAPPPNFDESKANPYPKLPDPLILNNGKKVTTAKMWWEQRRPQIVEDFDREVYGRVPPHTPKVTWEVAGTSRETAGKFAVITKQLVGHVDNSSYPQISVNIRLSLTTPANASGPVPIILQFSSSAMTPPSGARAAAEPLWKQLVLEKGWGYAVISTTSIQAGKRRRAHKRRHHWPGQQGPVPQTRRLGSIARLGVGSQPCHGLLRDGPIGRCQASWP